MKRIGIFGGTFNPTHKGHLNALKWAKESGNLDEVWLFPTYITPGKFMGVERISSKHRLNILKKSVKDFGENWMKVSSWEIKQKGASYTYKTVKMMKNKFPRAEIVLIMGDDSYGSFHTWRNYEKLREEVSVVIMRRLDKKLAEVDSRDKYISNERFKISSTNVLEELNWDNLFPSAKEYIRKNKLYLKEIAYRVLADRRWDHTLSVATHAKRLMKKNYKFGSKDAFIAGLIHDLTKYMPTKVQLKMLGKGYEDIPEKALHGFTAAKWLEDVYGYKNKKILQAMRRHTLAAKDMSKLDKVLYVADKIASDRKGRKFFVWRRLAYKDLDATFQKILRESTQHLINKGIEPHKDTMEAYDQYVRRDFGVKKK